MDGTQCATKTDPGRHLAFQDRTGLESGREQQGVEVQCCPQARHRAPVLLAHCPWRQADASQVQRQPVRSILHRYVLYYMYYTRLGLSLPLPSPQSDGVLPAQGTPRSSYRQQFPLTIMASYFLRASLPCGLEGSNPSALDCASVMQRRRKVQARPVRTGLTPLCRFDVGC